MLTLASSLFGLIDGFDDTYSNGLSHVTDGETTERRIFVIALNTLIYTSLERFAKLILAHAPWACLG